jgi:undecaprenyl diphosphate synthase
MSILNEVQLDRVPEHVAIIMDGNGRWAKKHGQARLFGHANGVESVRSTLKGARRLGVKFLTLYAFSTENWGRPKDEIDGLMSLIIKSITNELEEVHKNGVKILCIGDQSQLPKDAREEIQKAIKITQDNKDITLVVALNYSSRWEITKAIKEIAIDIKKEVIQPENVSDELISSYLSTREIPDPDLLIRTSGEFRISNFLLWQIAYTEFHFTDVLWPDFRDEDLYRAVIDYQSRERRFGKTTEQIKK